jgi:hypothetical protein
VAPCPGHVFQFPRSFPELSPCPGADLRRRPGQQVMWTFTVKKQVAMGSFERKSWHNKCGVTPSCNT